MGEYDLGTKWSRNQNNKPAETTLWTRNQKALPGTSWQDWGKYLSLCGFNIHNGTAIELTLD